MPLSQLNIESELSYAYLHAIASHAGISCRVGIRHEDDHGIDAQLTAWPDNVGPGDLSEVDLKVQLKATVADSADGLAHLPYRLRGRNRYDDLREETLSVPRILVVLFLPHDHADWINHTPDQLLLRRCAYWQSLRGAPPIVPDSVGIQMPRNQPFSSAGLTTLIERLSRRDIPRYPNP